MKIRRFLSLIPVLAMLLAIALPIAAFAADNASITIKAPAGFTIDEEDFVAYRLCGVTVDSTGENFGYTPTTALTTFIAANSPDFGEDFAGFMEYLFENETDLTDLVQALMAAGFGTGGTPENDDPDVVIRGLDFGYYLVAGKGSTIVGEGQSPVKVAAYSALVTVHAKSVDLNEDIILKADAPEIHKYVSATSTVGDGKSASVNIGDEVFFKLVSAVPNMEGYTAYTFKVYDTLSVGLSLAPGFDETDVAITIGSTEFSDFTVAADGQELTITFGSSFISYKESAGSAIVIEYSAVLNEVAAVGMPGNPNTVYLQYSNDPYGTTTGETPEDEVDVFTFGLDIKKVDGKTTTKALDGAEFELRTAAGNPATAVAFTKDGGIYRVDPDSAAVTLISGADGMISIKGLDAGVYYLVETKAPDTYNALTEAIQLKIESNGDVKLWNPKAKHGTGAYGRAHGILQVENFSGDMLPGTGGIGSTIFYVVGLIALISMAAGTVALIRKVKIHGIV